MRSLARAAALALVAALLAPAAAAELWQWSDADGAVRYTPDPSRVPASRRGTLVKVEPGMALPDPVLPPSTSGPSAIYAPSEEIAFEADPFNAPEPARGIDVREVPEAEPTAAATRGEARGTSPAVAAPPPPSPEELPRRAQLEAQIAQDEEKIKELIGREAAQGGDPLEKSPELREIARRLPALQAELRALEQAQAQREGNAALGP